MVKVRMVVLLLALSALAVTPALAQTPTPAPFVVPTGEPNPNANISYPPPVYVVRGEFPIRGTVNLPNQMAYFIEYRPLNPNLTIPDLNAPWFPATLPSTATVQNDVLGIWNTLVVPDGMYELRLTIQVSGGFPVTVPAGPVRVENNPPPFAIVPTIAPPQPTLAPLPVQPTLTLAPIELPTLPPAPTVAPTVDTTPRGTITSSPSGNVRGGDTTLHPIITSLPTGTTMRIIGVSANNTGWYQVQLDDGRIGWVAPSIVNVSGNLAGLPRIQPPPPPATPTFTPTFTPIATNTPVPTNTPTSAANLVAGNVYLDPTEPVCNETFKVGIDIANLGSVPTGEAKVRMIDYRAVDGQQLSEKSANFPALNPGQTVKIDIEFKIPVYHSEQHRLVIQVDYENKIIENNENDNTRELLYTLKKGSCPG